MIIQTKYAQIKNNELYIDDVRASDLVKQYGTPLYVMSEGHLRDKLEELQVFMNQYEKSLALFASKSFSCLAMYKLIKEYNIGIDCVSAGEMSIALKAGVDPDKIYFHGNNKLPVEINYALNNNVYHFVADNFYELDLLERIASKLNKKVFITLRVVPEIKAGANEKIQTGMKDTKFGFPSSEGIYLKAIQQVLESSSLVYEGIHAHIGSQVFELNAYKEEMYKFMKFADEVYQTFHIVTSKINAGGGYGIAYIQEDKPLDFNVITQTIMSIIYSHYDQRGWTHPSVMIEPGRYVTGNAGITLYTIGSIKEIPGMKTYVAVDGGMTDHIRTALYNAKYEGIIANKASEKKNKIVTIAGKCCESGDILIRDIKIPDSVESGDLFAIFSTGAYHYTMSSNYNQLPKPAIVFTYKGQSRLVVRRQTFDDLIALDIE